jgi:hypothetical protein
MLCLFGFCIAESLLLNVKCSVQWSIAGGASDHYFVVSRQKLPGIFGGVEDGEIERFSGDAHFLRFAGRQLDALPSSEALEVLIGGRGKRHVKLSDLRAVA